MHKEKSSRQCAFWYSRYSGYSTANSTAVVVPPVQTLKLHSKDFYFRQFIDMFPYTFAGDLLLIWALLLIYSKTHKYKSGLWEIIILNVFSYDRKTQCFNSPILPPLSNIFTPVPFCTPTCDNFGRCSKRGKITWPSAFHNKNLIRSVA